PDIRGGGVDPCRRDLDRLAKLPHVRAKLSGLVTEADWRTWTVEDIHRYVHAALDSFCPERLMMGSDWPVCAVAAGYSEVIDLVRSAIADRPASERAAIMGGTARTFW